MATARVIQNVVDDTSAYLGTITLGTALLVALVRHGGVTGTPGSTWNPDAGAQVVDVPDSTIAATVERIATHRQGADLLPKLRHHCVAAFDVVAVYPIEHTIRCLGTTRVEGGQPIIIALPLSNERPDFVDGHCAKLRHVRTLNKRRDFTCQQDEHG